MTLWTAAWIRNWGAIGDLSDKACSIAIEVDDHAIELRVLPEFVPEWKRPDLRDVVAWTHTQLLGTPLGRFLAHSAVDSTGGQRRRGRGGGTGVSLPHAVMIAADRTRLVIVFMAARDSCIELARKSVTREQKRRYP